MSKSKKRKKKNSSSKISLKPHNYIQKRARSLPIHECIVEADWQEIGLVQLYISRKRKNGNFIWAGYIVDIFCLGLKNTTYRFDVDPFEYQETMDEMRAHMDDPITIDPNLAFNIIYGAIEYAEDLGFEPHKDFKITEYMLDEVSTVEYIDIPFGKDGKPFFIEGPYDNKDRIHNTLMKNVGEGNFHYLMEPDNDMMEDEFDEDFEEEFEFIFPEEEIDRKKATLEDEETEGSLMFLFIGASVIHRCLNGNYDKVVQGEEDYDKEFDLTVDALEDIVLNKLEMESEEERMMLYNHLIDNVQYLYEKLEEHGDFKFLLEKDFQPYVRMLSTEEIESLPEEEKMIYLKKLINTLPSEQKDDFLSLYFVDKVILQKTNQGAIKNISDELAAEINQQAASEYSLFLSENPQHLLHQNKTGYIRELTYNIIEDYNS